MLWNPIRIGALLAIVTIVNEAAALRLTTATLLFVVCGGCAHSMADSMPDLTQAPVCEAGAMIANTEGFRFVPGQTVCLRVNSDSPDLLVAETVADSESANVILRSWRHEESDVFVSIENYIGQPLKLTLLMRVPNVSGFVPTSSCPVTKLALEHWPHPILEFQVAELSTLSPNEQMVCK